MNVMNYGKCGDLWVKWEYSKYLQSNASNMFFCASVMGMSFSIWDIYPFKPNFSISALSNDLFYML